MAAEIERKFLIDRAKLGALRSGSTIKQAYISTTDNTTVRIRVCGKRAFLTLKGKNKGLRRTEFEYAIPLVDANEMISELCSGPVIEKTRYLVEYMGHTWEVDIFDGENQGLEIAEIELTNENEQFVMPPWVVEEVSGDARYYNFSLFENPYKNWKNPNS